MEEKSLRITGTNTTFLNKITKTLTKMLIPTKIGINGMLITIKRNSLIKAYENYVKDTEDYNKEELEKKYDEAYTPNQIIEQYPAPGAQVHANMSVKIYINTYQGDEEFE